MQDNFKVFMELVNNNNNIGYLRFKELKKINIREFLEQNYTIELYNKLLYNEINDNLPDFYDPVIKINVSVLKKILNLDNYLDIKYPLIDMGDIQYSNLTRDLYYLEKLIRLKIVNCCDKIFSRSTILENLIKKRDYYICTDKIHCARKINCIDSHILDILNLIKDDIEYSVDMKITLYMTKNEQIYNLFKDKL